MVSGQATLFTFETLRAARFSESSGSSKTHSLSESAEAHGRRALPSVAQMLATATASTSRWEVDGVGTSTVSATHSAMASSPKHWVSAAPAAPGAMSAPPGRRRVGSGTGQLGALRTSALRSGLAREPAARKATPPPLKLRARGCHEVSVRSPAPPSTPRRAHGGQHPRRYAHLKSPGSSLLSSPSAFTRGLTREVVGQIKQEDRGPPPPYTAADDKDGPGAHGSASSTPSVVTSKRTVVLSPKLRRGVGISLKLARRAMRRQASAVQVTPAKDSTFTAYSSDEEMSQLQRPAEFVGLCRSDGGGARTQTQALRQRSARESKGRSSSCGWAWTLVTDANWLRRIAVLCALLVLLSGLLCFLEGQDEGASSAVSLSAVGIAVAVAVVVLSVLLLTLLVLLVVRRTVCWKRRG